MTTNWLINGLSICGREMAIFSLQFCAVLTKIFAYTEKHGRHVDEVKHAYPHRLVHSDRASCHINCCVRPVLQQHVSHTCNYSTTFYLAMSI